MTYFENMNVEMKIIMMGNRLAQAREQLAVMYLINFPHLCLEIRVMGMIFEEGFASVDEEMEICIGMMEIYIF